ncbi:heme ABC transporter ATP-binding protein [Leptospira ilyithenensis]|uniref:Heme ABC transporter ATP-binding protein n=1 Tax=Leptospira ilyithenensis TaxID=2484901 RepID=A0A4V3JXG7_9LEPT|nr:heme ABC transporter ATP-binding protein [Leptospira ilyithenensis]TGN13722.1 heme ABC transporter ATP-binding protein [Leptospira ilyithenensis]
MSLVAKSVSFSIGTHLLLSDISLTVNPGEVHVLMGKNGAGKSTLFKLLCGDLPPTSGEIHLSGKSIEHWKKKDLAKFRSVLTQDFELQFPFSTREVVELGRSPHNSTKAENEKITEESMSITNTLHVANRSYSTLSGGEKQRAQYSRVLSQVWGDPPKFLLLDEPTSSMDLPNQMKLLQVTRHMADQGYGILLILHDINTAYQFADKISLLRDGKLVVTGGAAEVLTEENIKQIFDVEMFVLKTPKGNIIIPKLIKKDK